LIIEEGVVPRQGKKGFADGTVFTVAIFIVFDVFSATMPTEVFLF
jgi:hypothetical protein